MTSQAARHRAGLAPTHPLAYVRQSRGWSYQELARVVADNARALGVPMAARREKVWRWEHWGVVPEPDSQRALARALGVPLRELEARPWPGWLPAHAGVPSGLPWTAAGSLSALQTLLESGTEDSRGYPIVVGHALRDHAADWAAAAATGCPPPPGSGDGAVDEGVVTWLEEGVLGLRRLDDRLGGGAVLHRVEADLRMVSDLLTRGAHSRAAGTRLFRIATDLAQLGGWAATDAGRHGVAQRLFLTGLRLAHTAQDRPLAACVLGGLSVQSVFTGRPQDALDMAEAAVRAAQGTASPRVRAMLASRLARAHAARGDTNGCRRALAEAAERLAPADRYRDPPWIYWFGTAALDAQTGFALLDLALTAPGRAPGTAAATTGRVPGQAAPAGPGAGDRRAPDRPATAPGLAAEAAAALDRALAGLGPDRVRDRAHCAVAAATAHALAGNRARARDLAKTAAALSSLCPSPRLTTRLEEAGALLSDDGPSGSSAEFDRTGGMSRASADAPHP